jgi:hypothetical protein
MNGSGGPGRGERADERMQPLRGTIPASATAESARRRLEREALPFLVVVSRGPGRVLGAVDREALAPRPCCGRTGGRCTVVQHLAPDVAFCFRHESVREVAETEAELAGEGRVPAARRVPLIVVDDDLRPLGCLPLFTGARAAAPPAAPRSAARPTRRGGRPAAPAGPRVRGLATRRPSSAAPGSPVHAGGRKMRKIMLRDAVLALALGLTAAAAPLLAPGGAGEGAGAEAARIERRLERLEARLLAEDDELRRMNRALGAELLAAMERASPGAADDARRLAALRAADASSPEARRLEARVEAARRAALRDGRVASMVDAFNRLLREKMARADPEAGRLLARYAELRGSPGAAEP